MAASFDVGRMGCATKVGCRRRLRSRVDFTSTREGSDVDIRTSSRLQINQPVLSSRQNHRHPPVKLARERLTVSADLFYESDFRGKSP